VEDEDDIRFALAEFLIQKGATVFACLDAYLWRLQVSYKTLDKV
jgi:DNA-binding response OmpR family regulator